MGVDHQANRRGAWLALGYGTWPEYCAEEFGTDRIKIPTTERPAVVSLMADAGMSLREISAATGLSKSTAANKKRRSSRSRQVSRKGQMLILKIRPTWCPPIPRGKPIPEPAGAGGPDDPSALPERHDQLVGPVEGAVVSPSPRDWAAEYEEAKRVREDLQHPLASIHVFRTTFRLDKITEIAARDPSFADDVRFHIRCIRKWLRELEKALGDSGSNRAHLRSVLK